MLDGLSAGCRTVVNEEHVGEAERNVPTIETVVTTVRSVAELLRAVLNWRRRQLVRDRSGAASDCVASSRRRRDGAS